MRDSIRLGRIAGIKVGLSWTVLLVAGLITLTLANSILPIAAPGFSDAAYWVVGILTAGGFLASILLHELGHSVVAEREGVRVDGITLWLLGGVARLRGEPQTPGAELRIAAAGPAVSVALAVGLFAAGWALSAFGLSSLLVAGVIWLGLINGVLALFNLLPFAPLDGGRITKALLWRRHGDRDRATITTAVAGRVGGYALIGLGLLQFLYIGGGGLWMAFIGWFVLGTARAEEAMARQRQRLKVFGPRIIDVDAVDVETVDA